jgi:hypothetical protein
MRVVKAALLRRFLEKRKPSFFIQGRLKPLLDRHPPGSQERKERTLHLHHSTYNERGRYWRNAMRKRIAFVLGAIVTLATPGYAMTWDLAADFSTVNNPDGPWEYGYRCDCGCFNLMTIYFKEDSVFEWWQMPQAASEIGLRIADYADYGVQPGHVSMECDGITPQVRWIAPSSGTYYISIVIGGTTLSESAGYGNVNANYAEVAINGSIVSATGSLSGPNEAGKTWSLAGVNLTTGDVLDTWIPGGWHNGGNTDTTITVSTSPVPEPLTILTLGMGAAWLLGRKRIRKSK